MCLGEVAEVIAVTAAGSAVVSAGGRARTISLITLEHPVSAGDWVVVHSGFALSHLTSEQAHDALELRATAPTASREGTS
jgi:hydrogenase assembly chaperone HypC/HupF